MVSGLGLAHARMLARLLLVVAALAWAAAGEPVRSPSSDLQVVMSRLADFYLAFGDCTQTEWCLRDGPTCGTQCSNATMWASTILPNGTWSDVDYSGKDLTDWQPIDHMMRVLALLRAYRCPDCESNSVLLDAAHAAFLFWVQARIPPSQWWWAQIGEPQYVAAAAVLLGQDITPAELTGAIGMLVQTNPAAQDGENLVWELSVDINRAAITGNVSLAQDRFSWLWSSITVMNGSSDGIKPDNAFYFHGALLQSGAYGADYALNVATMAAMAAGTVFSAPPETLAIISNYIWQGQASMIHVQPPGPSTPSSQLLPLAEYDLLVKGREIVRPPIGSLGYPSDVMLWASDLLRSDPSVAGQQFGLFADRLAGRNNATAANVTRHFWYGDYTAHQRPRFAQGVRVWSNRTDSAECVNGEGLQSWHMSGGLLTTSTSGAEYDGVFPAWDWDSLPGLSTLRGVQEDPCDVRQLGLSAIAGGVSDGQQGVTLSVFASGSWHGFGQPMARAFKSWYFLEEGTLVVTSDLIVASSSSSGLDPSVQLSTSLEQRLIRAVNPSVRIGNVTSVAPASVPAGQHMLTNTTWVWHDGVTWALLDGQSGFGKALGNGAVSSVTLLNDAVNGSYHAISQEAPANETVIVDMLLIRAEHGAASLIKSPVPSFAYAALPALAASTAESVPAALAELATRTQVVAASNSTHAVVYTPPAPRAASTYLLLASFAAGAGVEPGSAPTGMNVQSVSAPAALVVQADATARVVTFSAADPANGAAGSVLRFTIDQSLTTASGAVTCSPGAVAGTTSVTIQLPMGDMAGSVSSGSCAMSS